MVEKVENPCVCAGNWRDLIAEYDLDIGATFVDGEGNKFVFFGLVHSDDDYYFGLNGKAGLRLLSCVGGLYESFGLRRID